MSRVKTRESSSVCRGGAGGKSPLSRDGFLAGMTPGPTRTKAAERIETYIQSCNCMT